MSLFRYLDGPLTDDWKPMVDPEQQGDEPEAVGFQPTLISGPDLPLDQGLR